LNHEYKSQTKFDVLIRAPKANISGKIQEAVDGYRQACSETSANPEEVRKKALEDPEIRQILADPAMNLILEQMSQDPKAVRE